MLWDYIVIGGGIGGTVVSNRLLRLDGSLKILVVEAGPDVSHREDLLYANATNLVGGDFDWAYKSVPQENYGGRQIDIPAGRCVGGGSAINSCWFFTTSTRYG